MKETTKTQMKTIGGNAVANALTAALGAMILGGAKAIGGKIGSVFTKKELAATNVTIPEATPAEAVTEVEMPTEDIKVETNIEETD
jgi:hypothetical protein